MKNKSFKREIDVRKTVGTTIIVVCAFLLFCLITRSAILGVISDSVANFFLGIFGVVAYAVVSAGIVAGIMVLLKRKITLPKMQIVNFCAMFFAAILLVQLITSRGSASADDYATYLANCYDYPSMSTFGGAFAGLFVWPLCNALSVFGAYVFVIALFILTIFICIEYFFKISNMKIEKEEKEVVQKENVVHEYPQSKLFVATVDENKDKAPQQKTSKSFEELYGEKMQNDEASAIKKKEEQSQKSAHEQLYGDYWQDTSYTNPSQPQRGAIPNSSYTKDFESYYSSPSNNYDVKSAPTSSFGNSFNQPPVFFHSENDFNADSFNIKKTDEFLFEEKNEKQIKKEDAKRSLYALKGGPVNGESLPPIVNGDEVSDRLKKKDAYEQQQYSAFPPPRSLKREEPKPVVEQPVAKEEKIEPKQIFEERVEEKVVENNIISPSVIKVNRQPVYDDLFEEDVKKPAEPEVFEEKSVEDEISRAVEAQKADNVYIPVIEEKQEELYNPPVYQTIETQPVAIEENYDVFKSDDKEVEIKPIFEDDLMSDEEIEEISVVDAVIDPIEVEEEKPQVEEQPKEEPVKFVEKPFINKTEKAFQVGIANVVGDKKEEKPVHKYKKYVPPIFSLLDDAVFDPKMMSEDFEGNGLRIQETLAEFKIESTLRNIIVGPTVTRYEFEKAPGVSITKVNSVLDDIALAVAAPGPVRPQLPIPGMSLFGIEVPNKKVAKVPLRSVLESPEFLNTNKGLTFGLGIDIGGKKITADLADMPHLLIAGSTGQGKSVCVNSIIISLLYKYSPEELRFIMVDPKQVEFSLYEKLPHLMIKENIICEPEKAISAFDWLIKEMERRFSLFKEYQERDIDGYNKAIDTETTQKLPRIVLIVDEVADLMQYNKSEIESRIQKLAQKARAAGIHLILATQRPSVDVITGVIKSNFPARLALRVTSAADSRTIMQQGGPEKLVAKGDMLFQTGNMPEPIRLQGALILTDEVKEVVDYIAANNESYFDNEIAEAIMKSKKDNSDMDSDEELDELFFQALKYVIEAGQASISMILRRFSIGYNRAGRLLQEMENKGYVSQFEGAKPRQVLITMEEYNQRFGDK